MDGVAEIRVDIRYRSEEVPYSEGLSRTVWVRHDSFDEKVRELWETNDDLKHLINKTGRRSKSERKMVAADAIINLIEDLFGPENCKEPGNGG